MTKLPKKAHAQQIDMLRRRIRFLNAKTAPNEYDAAEIFALTYAIACMESETPADVARLQVGHDRYETARRLNPRQWAEAWEQNIRTGRPFDEIIDGIGLRKAS